MIRNIDKYLETLLSSNVSVSALEDALKIFNSSEELVQILDNPNVSQSEKHAVIDDLFAPSVRAFIAELAAEGSSAQLEEILCAYINEIDKKIILPMPRFIAQLRRMMSSSRVLKLLFARRKMQARLK